MAEKIIRDNLTVEKLMGEMNSPLFLDYLEKSIGQTRSKGYETAFELVRSPEADSFYYPNMISVGDNTSVGIMEYQERHFQLIDEFEKKFNISFPNFTDHASSGEGTLEYNRLREDYEDRLRRFLQEKGEDFEIDVPTPKNKCREYSWHFQDCYSAIGVHTHPVYKIGGMFEISNMIPSVLDLRYLRKMKRNLENGNLKDLPQDLLEEEDGLIKIVANPIMLIAGTGELNSGYPLRLLTCYSGLAKNREIEDFNLQMREMERRGFSNPTPKMIRDGNFAQVKGYYNPRKGKVDFEVNSLDVLLESD